MAERKRWHLWSGFWATSLGTLASRVLGLARDVATAALLGLGEAGVMDAFVIAFRVPNLLRRIFGEGALAASFLPVFTRQADESPHRGWQLLSVLFAWLAMLLVALVLVGEIGCAWWWLRAGGGSADAALVGLLAAMLPYLVLIFLAAHAAAALQSLLEFRVPAVAPMILNVCWLAAAWLVAPRFEPDKLAQAYVIAVAVLISGVLQFGVQWAALRRLGFRFDYDWHASRDAFWLVVRTTLPVALGLAVTQLNTLTDSLIAWILSAPEGAAHRIAWLGGNVAYPMQTGAAAAIYYGERFYQLPVGILGVAIATVIYPLLSRHAARGAAAELARDLSLGLRLVTFTALPASVGMMLVAEPATRLLFERGAFTAYDAQRAAAMIACYASGVWAYCAIPVLVRGFYAVGHANAPAKLGLVAVAVNLALNLTLIWPLAERGLAVSTAVAAGVQVLLLATTFSSGVHRLPWAELATTFGKCMLATLAMTSAVLAVRFGYPLQFDSSRAQLALQLLLMIGGGAASYLAAARLLHIPELGLLLRRPRLGEAIDRDD
ncbi:MAG: murein biosynthesis integral membrane protein MurJ [Pirellulales bacterium]